MYFVICYISISKIHLYLYGFNLYPILDLLDFKASVILYGGIILILLLIDTIIISFMFLFKPDIKKRK